MRFAFERISQPSLEPVTLEEARLHLKCIDGVTTDNDLIESLITVAREWAEDFTGRALIDQGWRLTITASDRNDDDDQWRSAACIWIGKAPALTITRFVSVDPDGVETEVDSQTYELRDAGTKWPRIIAKTGATWMNDGELIVEFRAGYLEETSVDQDMRDAVPARFKQAIKLHVEAHYDRDPTMMPLLLKAAEAMIKPERIDRGFA